MTDAQVSQVATEVIRTNLAVAAQVSQLAVEVLRPNVPKGISAATGTYTLIGVASTGTYKRAVTGATGTYTLTGVAAASVRTWNLMSAAGSFTLTGQAADLKRPGKLFAEPGAIALSGQAALLERKYRRASSAGSYTLTGKSAAFARSFNLTSAAGAVALFGRPASLTRIANIVDPVSGITILHRLRMSTPAYTDADAAYEAWAATLGVDPTGTDYTGSSTLNTLDLVTTDLPVTDGATYSGVCVPHSGALGLYMTDPGSTAFSSTQLVWGAVSLGTLLAPVQRPAFMVRAFSTGASLMQYLNTNLKLRKGFNPTTGAYEVIVVMTSSATTSPQYPIRCAYRFCSGYLEGVFTADPVNMPPSGYLYISYIVSNETSDIAVDGSMMLTSSVGGTFGIVTDDYSALRPVLQETVNTGETTQTKKITSPTLTDTAAWRERVIANFGLTVTNTLAATDATSYSYTPGAVVEELFALADTEAPAWKFSQLLAERVALRDAIIAAFPVAVTDDVTLTELIQVFRGAIVAELIGLVDVPQGAAQMATQLVDTLLASDDLRRFLGGNIQESLTAADAVAYAPILGKVITDSIAMSDLAAGKLIFRITADETFALDDATALKTIFSPVVTDGVEIAIGYIEPNGSFTTWAINTRTGAVTEYQNYSFNSFCQNGHKYLGASASGLYELDGDDDAGSDIIAQIKSGFAQFGGSKYSSFKAAYLGMRGDGDIILKLETGDNKSYTYQTVIQDMQSTKVRLGKGLRARYFSFELISTGPDFDLDTIEFIPLVAQRRV